ncbi:MAG: hypothetical protein KGN01_06015 [Patescibacteria group bacterium]|nr:hypothetical protein [Patescibacteria group bacterium]
MSKSVKMSYEEFMELKDENIGICLNCNTQHDCLEPDARNVTCDNCDLPQVFGLEELLIMDALEITD